MFKVSTEQETGNKNVPILRGLSEGNLQKLQHRQKVQVLKRQQNTGEEPSIEKT